MLKKSSIGAGVVGLLLLASMPPGMAHEQAKLDADETSGPLDIVVTQHRHRSLGPGTSLIFKIVTYEKWSRDVIAEGGHRFISIELNLDQDSEIERCFVMNTNDSETFGIMYKNCRYFGDEQVGSKDFFPARQLDEHTIRAEFPKRLLGRGVSQYRWRAVTSFEERNQDNPCFAPESPRDGGYGICADFTDWKSHKL